MFNINNNLTGALYINGKEFLLDQGNALNSVHISASALYKLPVMQINFLDALNLMPQFGLQDNVPLVFALDGLYKYARNFRVLNFKSHPVGNGFQYSINCYWDAPKWWAGSGLAGLTGTSAAVIAQIAEMCGLKQYPKNTKTSDAMTWMQGNRSYSEYAREVARHGYVSDTSHMMLAVDSLGYVRYLDINALDQQQVQVSPTPPAQGTGNLMITDFSPVTKSGFNNVVGGYLNERHAQQADAGSTITGVENEVTLNSDSRYPLVNSEARDLVARGPITYAPINYGNVHDNYERARYQNVRFNLLKSLSGQFLFGFQTPLEPGNQVVLSQVPDRNASEYNGVYTITQKIVFIQGSSYNEKIIGVKNGLSV
jgi:hypothetical protein